MKQILPLRRGRHEVVVRHRIRPLNFILLLNYLRRSIPRRSLLSIHSPCINSNFIRPILNRRRRCIVHLTLLKYPQRLNLICPNAVRRSYQMVPLSRLPYRQVLIQGPFTHILILVQLLLHQLRLALQLEISRLPLQSLIDPLLVTLPSEPLYLEAHPSLSHLLITRIVSRSD